MDVHRPVDPRSVGVNDPVRLIVKPVPPPLPLNVRSGWIEIVLLLVTESVSVAPGWQNRGEREVQVRQETAVRADIEFSRPAVVDHPVEMSDFALGTSSFAIVPVAVA